jgi:putative MATE family efflux protein
MIGSAAQNIIALTDSVFLYHYSEIDFAAIGFVSVFYLVIAAIGYGFSRAGQIIIARRKGEGNIRGIEQAFFSLIQFEIGMAVGMFIILQYFPRWIFSWFIEDPQIMESSLAYIKYRSWGIFFSYTGVAIIALYAAIARTKFIMIDTLVLVVSNIILNYIFIFGYGNISEMGIAGAGLASTVAEGIAFICFAIYMFFDNKALKLRRRHIIKPKLQSIKSQFRLGWPIVVQTSIGLGSWVFFFGIVENLGMRTLAVANIARIVYLILSIPAWGYSAGIHTLVSQFIGYRKRQAVIPIIWRTSFISFITTMIISLPVVLFPTFFLYPLLGGEDMSLIQEAKPVLVVVLAVMIIFSIGSIFFSGMTGTGATFYGLKVQAIITVVYLIYIYIAVNVFHGSLQLAWTSEILYWAAMLLTSVFYLRSKKWFGMKV